MLNNSPLRISILIYTVLEVCRFGLGSQLTLQEFKSISKILEKEVKAKYPSDAKDKYSDTVTQVVKGDAVTYDRGDPKQPVFFTFGKDRAGQSVIVIERGADYIIPEDKNTFVVLRKRSSGKVFNVHIAVFMEIGTNTTAVFLDNARIEQRAGSAAALNLMGKALMPQWTKRDARPRCEWLGNVLLCNANKTVPSPPRIYPDPPKTQDPKPRPAPEDKPEDYSVDDGGTDSNGDGGKPKDNSDDEGYNPENNTKDDKDGGSDDSKDGSKDDSSKDGDNSKDDNTKDDNTKDDNSKDDSSKNGDDSNDGDSSKDGGGSDDSEKQESEERYIKIKAAQEGGGGDEPKGRTVRRGRGRSSKGRASHKGSRK